MTPDDLKRLRGRIAFHRSAYNSEIKAATRTAYLYLLRDAEGLLKLADELSLEVERLRKARESVILPHGLEPMGKWVRK